MSNFYNMKIILILQFYFNAINDMKNFCFTLILVLIANITVFAQNGVSINTDGTSPDASAILDAKSTDKGILIPRVALTATNSASPISSPATGLMVYNTASAGTPPNEVTPGFYYWNGSVWNRFTTGNTVEWKLGGNTVGAVSSLGTIDNFALPFITNNTERLRILNDGRITNDVTALGANPRLFSMYTSVDANRPIYGGHSGAGTAVMGAHTASSGAGAGVLGTSASATGWGLQANNTNSSGTGAVLVGNNISSITGFTSGVGSHSVGTVYGALGAATTSASGNGVLGVGNNINPNTTVVLSSGSGVTGNGTNAGIFGYSTGPASSGVWGYSNSNTAISSGVYGTITASPNNTANYGVWGDNTSTNASSAGVYGSSTTAGIGVLATNTSTGQALYAQGSGAKTANYVANIIENTATSSTNVTKIAAQISSTGTWNAANARNVGANIVASGGTINIPLILQSGDFNTLNTGATLRFMALNSAIPTSSGWAMAEIAGHFTSVSSNSSNFGGSLIFRTHPDVGTLSVTSTERMRIRDDGRVGIGTTTPNQLLEVAGDINVTTGNGFRINNTATSGQFLRGNGTRFVSSAILAADIPSGSGNYIQNQNASAQATSTFWLSGSGRSDVSFISTLYTSIAADVALRSPASQAVRIQSGGTTDRIVVASGGGVTISNMPAAGTGVNIDMTAGTNTGATGLSIGSFASNTNARNGISIDLSNTSNSNGIAISNIGATSMNGININSTSNGNGTGIRIGETTTLGTGVNIRGGTGVNYNALTAGSGTGISIGGTTAPNIGITTTVSGSDNYGGRFLGNSSGIGVLGSATSGAYTSIPTFIPLIGVRGYAASNSTSASDHHYGLYGFAERAGTGTLGQLNYGVFGSVAINSSTNAGLGAGVYGTVSSSSSYAGTAGGFGGLFNAASSAKTQALAATGGADVYLGSSDADRPSSLTSFLGTGNTNTTRVFNQRVSGTQTFVGSTSGTVGISASATVTTYSLVLPTAQGAASTFLHNDGSGNLSWVSAGTVTSVGLTMPTGFSVTGSPVTGSGTLAVSTTLNGPLRGNGSGFTTGNTNLASEVTGILPLANGGTNANLTATNGGILWSNASQVQITAAGTANDILQSNGAAAPTWVSGSSLFIQNQNSANQTGNYRITGVGRANTSFDAPMVQSITGSLTLQSQSGGNMVFNTNGATERMRIASDGKVSINTTTATQTLTVNGGFRAGYRLINDVNTTLDQTDYFVEITGDNDYTVTFPDPATCGAGATLFIRLNYTAGDKTIASDSGSQIHLLNAASPIASIVVPVASSQESSIFISNGSVWMQLK